MQYSLAISKAIHCGIVFLFICITLSPLLQAQNALAGQQSPTPPITKTQYNCNSDSDLWIIIITVGSVDRDQHGVSCMTNLLTSQGYSTDHLFSLIEEEATKENILKMPIEWLKTQNVSTEDRILFFFSMHGTVISDQKPLDEPDGLDECLVPYDSNGNITSYIRDDDLASTYTLKNFSHLFFVFETCYSGGMIDGEADLAADGRVIITSSAANEPSWSIRIPNRWLFPHYFFRGLTGLADQNKDRWISAEESYYFAEPRIVLRSTILARLFGLIPFIPHEFYPQHPQLFDGWPSRENNAEDLFIKKL